MFSPQKMGWPGWSPASTERKDKEKDKQEIEKNVLAKRRSHLRSKNLCKLNNFSLFVSHLKVIPPRPYSLLRYSRSKSVVDINFAYGGCICKNANSIYTNSLNIMNEPNHCLIKWSFFSSPIQTCLWL